MLCSKLQCQKGFQLKPFFYLIGGEPLGPAEQLHGGSRLMSASSFCTLLRRERERERDRVRFIVSMDSATIDMGKAANKVRERESLFITRTA